MSGIVRVEKSMIKNGYYGPDLFPKSVVLRRFGVFGVVGFPLVVLLSRRSNNPPDSNPPDIIPHICRRHVQIALKLGGSIDIGA